MLGHGYKGDGTDQELFPTSNTAEAILHWKEGGIVFICVIINQALTLLLGSGSVSQLRPSSGVWSMVL